MGLKQNLISQELIFIPRAANIPIMGESSSRKNIGFGFSSQIVFLIWAIWGGFVLHMMLCEYLTVLIAPSYENAIKTMDDVIGKMTLVGLTIISLSIFSF